MRIDSWNADDFLNTSIRVDHVDHLCLKCIGNTGKNHRQKQLYYRISDQNTSIQQFIYLDQTKMAACQMVSHIPAMMQVVTLGIAPC